MLATQLKPGQYGFVTQPTQNGGNGTIGNVIYYDSKGNVLPTNPFGGQAYQNNPYADPNYASGNLIDLNAAGQNFQSGDKNQKPTGVQEPAPSQSPTQPLPTPQPTMTYTPPALTIPTQFQQSGGSVTTPNTITPQGTPPTTTDFNKVQEQAQSQIQTSGVDLNQPGAVREAAQTQSQETPAFPSVPNTINQTENQLSSLAQYYGQLTSNSPSLVQTYTNLLQQTGVSAEQMQLVDLNNIIRGSETDIRNEIQASGGFASESQIQALVTARNKQLILRQQALSDMIDTQNKYIDQIVSLTGEDRKNVAANVSAQFDMADKIATYNADLLKTKATEDLAYARLNQSAQNQSANKVISLASKGGYQGASEERLQAVSDSTGGQVSVQDIKDLSRYASTHQSLSLQNLIDTINNKNPAMTDPNTGMAIGTTGNGTIDPSITGYTTQAISSAGGMTQAAIDQAALSYATTGIMPSIGLGSTGQAAMKRTAIQNRAAELDPGGNIAAHKAEMTVYTQNLKTQSQYENQVDRSLTAAEQQLNQVVGLMKAKGINTSNITLANIISNAAQYQLSPEDISAVRAGLVEVGNEYQQVFSRGGHVTDTVRHQAEAIANGDVSADALQGIGNELQKQGSIVLGTAQAEVKRIEDQINNIIGGDTGSANESGIYAENLAKQNVIDYGKQHPESQQFILNLTTNKSPLGRPMTYSEIMEYLQSVNLITP